MHPARGSILFYILLAVAVFAALGVMVTGMLRGGTTGSSNERAKLNAHALIDLGGSARETVASMKLNGTATASLVFLRPGDGGYNVAPHTAKVFHPGGGGLSLPSLTGILVDGSFTPATGVYMTRNAIDDVGSSADEVILSVRGIKRDVCEQINRDLTGAITIPSTGANNHNALFVLGTTDLTAGVCASCAGKSSLCVAQSGPTLYTFYSVTDAN